MLIDMQGLTHFGKMCRRIENREIERASNQSIFGRKNTGAPPARRCSIFDFALFTA